MFMNILDMIEIEKLRSKQQRPFIHQRHVKAYDIRHLQKIPALQEWSLEQEWQTLFYIKIVLYNC